VPIASELEVLAAQELPHSLGPPRIFPVVSWAERGGGPVNDHGNSVPRFHITWGTVPGVVEPFERAGSWRRV
jgi:predicted oxidoreductase